MIQTLRAVLKRITERAVCLGWNFLELPTMMFSSVETAVINGNLAESYFSEVVYAGGKWSSPCEIGNRKLSAYQAVCRLWEDILSGYSTLYCPLLMGLVSQICKWPTVFILRAGLRLQRVGQRKWYRTMDIIVVWRGSESCIAFDKKKQEPTQRLQYFLWTLSLTA